MAFEEVMSDGVWGKLVQWPMMALVWALAFPDEAREELSKSAPDKRVQDVLALMGKTDDGDEVAIYETALQEYEAKVAPLPVPE